MSATFTQMQQLIDQFQVLRKSRHHQRQERMSKFLATFESESKNFFQPHQSNFNTFSLLQVATDEIRHSQFLAWLLDAQGGHGQGRLFMRAFADCCKLGLLPDALDVYRIRTEHVGNESIIDLMIYRQGVFLIYLENKIFASEGPNQLDREYRDLSHIAGILGVPEAQRYAIFLTPTGHRPKSGDPGHWRSLAYSHLATTFRKLLPTITVPKVQIVVSDWLDTIATFGGTYESL